MRNIYSGQQWVKAGMTNEDSAMTQNIQRASCSCGQLQAQVTADPIRVSVCHCLACQKRTGSVFGVVARFPSTSVTISGNNNEYVRAGDAGSRATFHFCPVCGATVYYTSDAMTGNIAIPVGAFAEPQFPSPTISVYEERMHSWVSMPLDIEHFA